MLHFSAFSQFHQAVGFAHSPTLPDFDIFRLDAATRVGVLLAALHSLSLTLRHQLRETSVRVFEVLPPIVETELDRGARERRGQKRDGISPEQVASETLYGMERNDFEVAVGRVKALRIVSRIIPKRFFGVMNRMTEKR